MEHGTLTDIAICVVAAWLFGVVAHVLRQPALVAYLIAGFVIGRSGLGFVTEQESIESIASIGLALLLFLIGLEIDLKRVLGAGRAIFTTAAVQIFGTIALGVAVFVAAGNPLGGGKFEALYLAIGAFVSSTVIAVKILTDKRELDTLAGRLSLGIAVIQDVALIVFLGVQPALANPSLTVVFATVLKIALLIGTALGFSKYILPPLFHRVATLPELVVVGALAWCFIIAAFAHSLGLSREMGALIAGVSISTYPYHLDVAAKVASLRDFFVTLFFVALGLTVPAPAWAPIRMAMLLCAFVVVSRFLTIMLPLRLLGMGNRVSFLTSLNLMPLSEFALVLVSLGLAQKHVTEEVFAPVVYAFFFLALVSSYAIGQSDWVFRKVEPWLVRFGLRDRSTVPGPGTPTEVPPDIFVLGFSWSASSLAEEIGRKRPDLLPRLTVIDFNPLAHRKLAERGVRAIWGDVSQSSTLEQAGLKTAKLVLCTLPNSILKGIDNVRLVRQIRRINPTARIVAHAEALSDVPLLEAAGAAHVLVPRLLDADELLGTIEDSDAGRLDGRFSDLRRRLASRSEVIA
ncbi:MAG: cation:proton antiporter [Verrucomicrobiales bacterium]|nr:cation:proton antiporter [Verrucomicrobiales bacterium]